MFDTVVFYFVYIYIYIKRGVQIYNIIQLFFFFCSRIELRWVFLFSLFACDSIGRKGGSNGCWWEGGSSPINSFDVPSVRKFSMKRKLNGQPSANNWRFTNLFLKFLLKFDYSFNKLCNCAGYKKRIFATRCSRRDTNFTRVCITHLSNIFFIIVLKIVNENPRFFHSRFDEKNADFFFWLFFLWKKKKWPDSQ